MSRIEIFLWIIFYLTNIAGIIYFGSANWRKNAEEDKRILNARFEEDNKVVDYLLSLAENVPEDFILFKNYWQRGFTKPFILTFPDSGEKILNPPYELTKKERNRLKIALVKMREIDAEKERIRHLEIARIARRPYRLLVQGVPREVIEKTP